MDKRQNILIMQNMINELLTIIFLSPNNDIMARQKMYPDHNMPRKYLEIFSSFLM